MQEKAVGYALLLINVTIFTVYDAIGRLNCGFASPTRHPDLPGF
jgi:hypothetical protein